MKVSASKYQTQKHNSFRSTYPVVYWLREPGGRAFPIQDMEMVKGFQEIVVRYLNDKQLVTPKEVKKLQKAKKNQQQEIFTKSKEKLSIHKLKEIVDFPAQRLRTFLNGCDSHYRACGRLKTKIRAIKDNLTDNLKGFIPVSYFASGQNALELDRMASEIGIKTREFGKDSEEVKQAKQKFYRDGLKYVNEYLRRKKDNLGKTQVLHLIFDIIKNPEGEITSYRHTFAGFYPEFGPNNPLESFKYV